MTTADSGASHKPRRFRFASKRALIRIGVLLLAIAIGLAWMYFAMIRMPGHSHAGPLAALTAEETTLAADLRRDVTVLAADVGQRSTFYPAKLAAAAVFARDSLTAAGYSVREHSFVTRGSPCPNFDAELIGTTAPKQIVLVGAHYDAYQGTPGADDNASGVAATLALARAFAGHPQPRTIRFALFVNEEPPAFQTADMGSWVYAKKCRADGDDIVAMISLETLGYFSEEPGSQKYPPPFGLLYPDTGNFIAFVGNYGSRRLTRDAIASFRTHAAFPSEGAAVFGVIPGVSWSDHWAFWKEGYHAIMVTDTAPFRNPHYHGPSDTPDTLDYDRFARVVTGLRHVVTELADLPSD